MEPTDVIVGVHIGLVSSSDVDAKDSVTQIANRVRDALVIAVARNQIRSAQSDSRLAERSAEQDKLRLTELNQNLDKVVSDLERLASRTAPAPSPTLIDPRDGGYFFLPPALQIDGIRSAQIHNRQAIRVAEETQALHAARLTFFRRLDEQIADIARKSGPADIPALVDRMVDGFLDGESPHPVGTPVLMDVKKWRDELAAFYGDTGLGYPPASSTLSRTPVFAAAALMVLVLVLSAAVARDAWFRSSVVGSKSTGQALSGR
jgi:hypothetical protein